MTGERSLEDRLDRLQASVAALGTQLAVVEAKVDRINGSADETRLALDRHERRQVHIGAEEVIRDYYETRREVARNTRWRYAVPPAIIVSLTLLVVEAIRVLGGG